MELVTGQNHLFVSQFEIIQETFGNDTIYQLKDWYQLLNNSTVPIDIVHGYDDFDLKSDYGIKIGGNSNSISQLNNRAFFLSKKYFKYDPLKLYKFTIRLKHQTSISRIFAGFVGYTSKPHPIKNYSTNQYLNETSNISNFVFTHNGIVLSYPLQNAADYNHYTPINKFILNDSKYHEYVGYISGLTYNPIQYNANLGLSSTNAVPIRTEVVYVAPFFFINEDSTSKFDNINTIIDFVKVDDEISFNFMDDNYYIEPEPIKNIDTYEPLGTIPYIMGGYIEEEYVGS